MELSAVEIFGYSASALIAYSLTQSSIVKLRWFNLFGASSFCIYGIIIGALPVALLNGFIAITNVIFLSKMLLQPKQHFSILNISRPSNYVDFFLDYHKEEIAAFFPRFFKTANQDHRLFFFMMENTEVVGVLSGKTAASNIFVVDFDFVIPAYRDCKLGEFVLGPGQELQNLLQDKTIVATADSLIHESYLERLGFQPRKGGLWTYQKKE